MQLTHIDDWARVVTVDGLGISIQKLTKGRIHLNRERSRAGGQHQHSERMMCMNTIRVDGSNFCWDNLILSPFKIKHLGNLGCKRSKLTACQYFEQLKGMYAVLLDCPSITNKPIWSHLLVSHARNEEESTHICVLRIVDWVVQSVIEERAETVNHY